MVQIDGQRLLNSLRKLRTFGALDNGVVRPTYSPIDWESREWLVEQMEAAGLDAVIDVAGAL